MKPLRFAALGLLVGFALVVLTPAQAQPDNAGPKMAKKETRGPGGAEAYDCDPRLWRITVVDGADADVGEYNSLAIPTVGPYAGRPAVSYYDATNGDLKFAWQDAQGWHTRVVDSAGNVGLYTSLGVSPVEEAPYPAISYVNETRSRLKVATCYDDNWDQGTWEPGEWWSDLDLIHNTHSTSLAFKIWEGEWAEPVVALGGEHPACGLGALLYLEEPLVATAVDCGKYAGFRCSMAIDPDNGRRAIAYTEAGGTLGYAWMDEHGEWDTVHVVYEDDVGWYCSVAFFPSDHPEEALRGEPVIAYHDGDARSLNLAWHERGAPDWLWHHCPVDPLDCIEEVVGRYPSLAILRNGQPAIAYEKNDGLAENEHYERPGEAPDDLWYAYHVGGYNFCEGWRFEKVDSGGQVGSHTSLAILPSGLPVISYYDETNGDLKCAFRRASVDDEVDER